MLGRRDEERHHLDLVIFVGAEEDLEIDQDGAESHPIWISRNCAPIIVKSYRIVSSWRPGALGAGGRRTIIQLPTLRTSCGSPIPIATSNLGGSHPTISAAQL